MSSLEEISNGLRTSNGLEFNVFTSKAFCYLCLDAHVINQTQAESDVIAEAVFSEEPYYIVIEAQAVNDRSEVGYAKLGQIRGNFTAYYDQRRQKLFSKAYKLIVGRPTFSTDARKRSEPDVLLINFENLIKIMEYHNRFNFSQDELELLFKRDGKNTYGEIDEPTINKILYNPYKKRININALIIYCLISDRIANRKWIPLQELVGMIKAYCPLLKINIIDKEIEDSINDIYGSYSKIIIIKDNYIRFNSFPLERMKDIFKGGAELFETVNEIKTKLETK